jgi:hypothetical protein
MNRAFPVMITYYCLIPSFLSLSTISLVILIHRLSNSTISKSTLSPSILQRH